MTDFTPFASLAGGVLIGAAAVLLMALNGRILGISGILGGLIPEGGADREVGAWSWRAAFAAGAVLAPLLLWAIQGEMPAIAVPVDAAALVIGGLLVGIGVSLGTGCTSGHGVCGIARLSPRSIAATLTFMATAVATVFVLRHIVGG